MIDRYDANRDEPCRRLLARGMISFVLLCLTGLSAASEDAFELGTDRPGHDFADFDVQSGARACQARCLESPRCNAWTFVGPEAPDGSGHCWLKDAVPQARSMADAVSGVVGLRLAVEHWKAPRRVTDDLDWVDLVVRSGDVDNFGFGWPPDFYPFSGRSTPSHPYPFSPEADDPPGTDRIMVGSGYDGNPPHGEDGYTNSTRREDNRPETLRIKLDEEVGEVEDVLLQLFVDDFQSPVWGSHFQVRFDGERMPGMETAINALEQTGPIGKLISLPVLPAYHRMLDDGVVELAIDDPKTGAGDGFAIDFARLLVNPDRFPDSVAITGRVTHAGTGRPLDGVLVTSALSRAQTAEGGRYELTNLPAGLVVVRADKDGYKGAARTSDLIAGQSASVDFRLQPAQGSRGEMARELSDTGRARIPGIYFDLDSAELRAESERALREVLALIAEGGSGRYRIEGHTDSQGEREYNQALSRRRAESVVSWLVAQGVSADRLTARGYGETRPVADNDTAAGRALNRRVEISVL